MSLAVGDRVRIVLDDALFDGALGTVEREASSPGEFAVRLDEVTPEIQNAADDAEAFGALMGMPPIDPAVIYLFDNELEAA